MVVMPYLTEAEAEKIIAELDDALSMKSKMSLGEVIKKTRDFIAKKLADFRYYNDDSKPPPF